jgi:hypothetical protein
MRSPGMWFLGVVVLTVAGVYVFGVRPRTRKQWVLVAVTLALAVWLLPMMVSLR